MTLYHSRAKSANNPNPLLPFERTLLGPVAGPSRLRAIGISSDSTASTGSAFINEDDDDNAFLQLRRLQAGQGLDSEQRLSVSAQCPECERYYLQGKFFKMHVKMCLGILDI